MTLGRTVIKESYAHKTIKSIWRDSDTSSNIENTAIQIVGLPAHQKLTV